MLCSFNVVKCCANSVQSVSASHADFRLVLSSDCTADRLQILLMRHLATSLQVRRCIFELAALLSPAASRFYDSAGSRCDFCGRVQATGARSAAYLSSIGGLIESYGVSYRTVSSPTTRNRSLVSVESTDVGRRQVRLTPTARLQFASVSRRMDFSTQR